MKKILIFIGLILFASNAFSPINIGDYNQSQVDSWDMNSLTKHDLRCQMNPELNHIGGFPGDYNIFVGISCLSLEMEEPNQFHVNRAAFFTSFNINEAINCLLGNLPNVCANRVYNLMFGQFQEFFEIIKDRIKVHQTGQAERTALGLVQDINFME